VLWTAGMEEGSLVSWYAPETEPVRDFGGGVFDSDGGLSAASTDRAHSGAWSAKLTLPTGAGGARLFRWRDLRAVRDTVQSVWLYIPRSYRLTGDPANGRFWDIAQFKSTTADWRHNDPLWFLNVRSRRGRLLPELIWWHRTLEGPRENQSGYRGFLRKTARVPVGRWFQLTSRIRQSSEFDGIVQFWIDGQKLFDFRDVRTSHRNCAYNAWCADTHWSVNNYSDGLAPAPAVIYADDAVIFRTPE
jgi:polysaccharide lyase-like protein